MDLLLIRHAIAEEPSLGLDDRHRALTPEGEARFAAAAAGMHLLGVAGDLLWHSPWRRAAETAEIAAFLFQKPPRAEPLLAETPDDRLMDRLHELPADTRLGLIGHQPWLGELAARLALGEEEYDTGIRVRKGGLIWLRGEPVAGGMEIEAVLKPSLLRQAIGTR